MSGLHADSEQMHVPLIVKVVSLSNFFKLMAKDHKAFARGLCSFTDYCRESLKWMPIVHVA